MPVTPGLAGKPLGPLEQLLDYHDTLPGVMATGNPAQARPWCLCLLASARAWRGMLRAHRARCPPMERPRPASKSHSSARRAARPAMCRGPGREPAAATPKAWHSGARCRPTPGPARPRGARPRLSHGTGRGLRRGGPCSGLSRPRGGGLRWLKVCGVAGGGGGAAVPSRFLVFTFFLHSPSPIAFPPQRPLRGMSGGRHPR